MKKAFTLIELMVCIAIIAIIAAIIFPIFNLIRINSLKIKSISNIKQLGMAWKMYCEDYDDTLMRSNYAYRHWFGDNSTSILNNYVNLKTLKDPLSNSIKTAPSYWIGYGYNSVYFAPTDNLSRPISINYSQINDTAKTVAFATVAGLFNVNWQEDLYPMADVLPSSTYFPTYHARYNQSGVVLWADLHASSVKPKYFNIDKKYVAKNLGFIDDDNKANTNELLDLE